MEPAVRRVRVLRRACVAERERSHRRPGAVVGQLVDDRGPRPAVRAVREWVAVPPVGRIGDLRKAFVAGRDVRRKEPVHGGGVDALVDREVRREAGRGARVERHPGYSLHPRTRRRIRPEAPGEGVERAAGSGGLDLDAAGGVPDPAGEPELGCEAPHERPEPDALDHALDRQGAGAGTTPAHARGGVPAPLAGVDGCAHAHRMAPTPSDRMCRRSPERRPSGRRTRPSGRRTRPSGRRTRPSGRRTRPSGREGPAPGRAARGGRTPDSASGRSALPGPRDDGAVSVPDRNPSALSPRSPRAEARANRARQEVPTA